jgi:hypothetical protein
MRIPEAKMQVRTKREKTLLILCIVVLVVALASVLSPSGKPVVHHSVLTADAANAQYHTKEVTYKNLTAQLDAMDPRIQKMTFTQPPDTVSAVVTQDLQKVAARSGIHLSEIKPLRALKTTTGLVVRVPLEVRFRASFQPDVVRFLYYLEDPAGKMVVDKIDITSGDSRLKTVEVSARVSVFTQSVTGVNGTGEGDTSDDSQTTGSG